VGNVEKKACSANLTSCFVLMYNQAKVEELELGCAVSSDCNNGTYSGAEYVKLGSAGLLKNITKSICCAENNCNDHKAAGRTINPEHHKQGSGSPAIFNLRIVTITIFAAMLIVASAK
jgi:hypothetical protein